MYKNQKKEMVIRLYNEGKTTREIASDVKMSLRDIGIIIREINKEPEPEPLKSHRARAYQMFLEGQSPVQVAIALDIKYDDVKLFYNEFLDLTNKRKFVSWCEEHERLIPFIVKVMMKMELYELCDDDIELFLTRLRDINNLDKIINEKTGEINFLNNTITRLDNETRKKAIQYRSRFKCAIPP